MSSPHFWWLSGWEDCCNLLSLYGCEDSQQWFMFDMISTEIPVLSGPSSQSNALQLEVIQQTFVFARLIKLRFERRKPVCRLLPWSPCKRGQEENLPGNWKSNWNEKVKCNFAALLSTFEITAPKAPMFIMAYHVRQQLQWPQISTSYEPLSWGSREGSGWISGGQE